jgi:hypothetical protein
VGPGSGQSRLASGLISTAHPDLDKEAEVNWNLQQLSLMQINVAHRPELTFETDRIFWVNRICEPLGWARLGSRRSVPRGGRRVCSNEHRR